MVACRIDDKLELYEADPMFGPLSVDIRAAAVAQ
jgi:hypothetical protein